MTPTSSWAGAMEKPERDAGIDRPGSRPLPDGAVPRFLPWWTALAVPFLLSACTVGPRYVSSAPPVPESWLTLPAGIQPGGEALGAWWEQFQDPFLTSLMRQAIERNLDLREAAGRVAEARALYRSTASDRYPAIEGDAEVLRQRSSENLPLPGGEAETFHGVGVSASWEVDLFGRVRRSVEAAGAGVQLSEEDRRDVLVSLCADVARSYVNVRTLQRRLEVARANLESQGQVVELTRVRRDGGIASSLDVAQAESVFANTQTILPPLEAFLGQEVDRLSVLLGENPGQLREDLRTAAPLPGPPATLGIGLPRDLIRQRPDVRRAERDLAAQTARIGVEKADLYPRLALLGTFGFDATDAAKVFEGSSRGYSFGPSLRWNLFAGGRVRALVRAQEARVEQALARYERSVLLALEEVEAALISMDRLQAEGEAVAEAVRAATRSLDLSTALYKDGVVDFQNVLDAQRTVLLFEDALARVEGAKVQSVIQLHRALGGAWRGVRFPDEGRTTGGQADAPTVQG